MSNSKGPTVLPVRSIWLFVISMAILVIVNILTIGLDTSLPVLILGFVVAIGMLAAGVYLGIVLIRHSLRRDV